MAAKGGNAANLEDQMLRMKFRSLPYTAPKRDQKLAEVTPEGRESHHQQSYKLWKRLNPGYVDNDFTTQAREDQQYDEQDFQHVDKRNFRQRDRHTEFVDYIVRDKALSRKGS
uniref:Uncharacterized protein n=1 Tax=Neobodo designis TaxID=312471 RepID=A0A7S1LEM5_NEODS|mmetsp:Transcript_20445/g.63578  ORF Transcript_20445/g.63578 Transcript_20445/m.63578 type:complete len:113 (+) Transcript_20445:42-380(+)|eukprot:CAMPEP_0174851848 /NCGR_PEP_ID=MMETSP1114-20130205/24162_1 /TAXON_ID=312471 /ORGANISM="Neobodo designis, Strain CCAP 1951/1" /LENGTH=112 /DNA_ID=CAMNT_0016086407 /DNA_START=41 /DNA_END=379 /DNA_ORIENTATION=+